MSASLPYSDLIPSFLDFLSLIAALLQRHAVFSGIAVLRADLLMNLVRMMSIFPALIAADDHSLKFGLVFRFGTGDEAVEYPSASSVIMRDKRA